MDLPVSRVSIAAPAVPGGLAHLPHREMYFDLGAPLATTGEPIESLLVVHSGLLSCLVDLSSGDQIETAMLGAGDIVGPSAPLGRRVWLHSVIAQAPSVLWTYDMRRAEAASEADSAFARLLFAHESWMLAQASQTAACNARHNVIQRLATWLLRAHDALHSDRMQFTQDFLCHMLGVQRPTLTITALRLQDEGAIRYRRGVIEIDRQNLESRACDCYRDLRSKREIVFSEFT